MLAAIENMQLVNAPAGWELRNDPRINTDARETLLSTRALQQWLELISPAPDAGGPRLTMTAVGASTLSPLIEGSIVAFLEQTTRFLVPAFIGDTIKPEHEIVALERKRSAGLLTLRVTLTNQRGEIILEGQHRYLVAYRPTA